MPARKRTRRTTTRRTRTTRARRATTKADQKVRETAAEVERASRTVEAEARKVRRRGLSNVYNKVRDIDQRDVVKTYEQVRERADSLIKNGQEQLRLISNQVLLMTEMLRDHWNRRHELPWRSVAAITAAVMYFLGPFDILPDFIPGLGAIDDFAIVGLCFRLVQADLREYAAANNIDLRPYGLQTR